MFFSNVSRLAAFVLFAFGILRILIGLTIANEWLLPYEEALAKYAPGASSSGDVINKATYTIAFALVLGTLAEIGRKT